MCFVIIIFVFPLVTVFCLYFIECKKFNVAKKKRETLVEQERYIYQSLLTKIKSYLEGDINKKK